MAVLQPTLTGGGLSDRRLQLPFLNAGGHKATRGGSLLGAPVGAFKWVNVPTPDLFIGSSSGLRHGQVLGTHEIPQRQYVFSL